MQQDKPDRELHFATLTLPTAQLAWVHARPSGAAPGTASTTTSSQDNLVAPPQAALRTCRRLQREHNLLASPLHDDGTSFYVMYAMASATKLSSSAMPTLTYGHVVQVLTDLGCVILDSAADEGVPTVIVECALRLALRTHLAMRGWFGVDACTYVRSPDPATFPPASDVSVLVDTVDLECQVSGDGTVCFSVEGSVRRITPFKLSSLEERKVYEDDGDLDTEHSLAGCVVLPSLNDGRVKHVAMSLAGLPTRAQKPFSSEDDFRQYWSEAYGYTLPGTLKGWAKVKVGTNSLRTMTYPLCCLLSSDLTLNPAQTRKRKGEIVHSFLTELKDVTIGLQQGSGVVLKFRDEHMAPRYATNAWIKCSNMMLREEPRSGASTDLPNTALGQAPLLEPIKPSMRTSTVAPIVAPSRADPTKSEKPCPVTRSVSAPEVKAPPTAMRAGRKLGTKRPKPMDPSTITAKGSIKERTAKRTKTTQTNPESGGADIQALAAAGKLNGLSVAQLRAFCKEKNLGLPKKKEKLINNIKTHFGLGAKKEE